MKVFGWYSLVMKKISSQNWKGALTLCLLLFAESVSLSNAIKLRSTYEAWVKNIRGESGGGGGSAGESFTTSTTSSSKKFSIGLFAGAAETNTKSAPFKIFSSERSNACAASSDKSKTCV